MAPKKSNVQSTKSKKANSTAASVTAQPTVASKRTSTEGPTTRGGKKSKPAFVSQADVAVDLTPQKGKSTPKALQSQPSVSPPHMRGSTISAKAKTSTALAGSNAVRRTVNPTRRRNTRNKAWDMEDSESSSSEDSDSSSDDKDDSDRSAITISSDDEEDEVEEDDEDAEVEDDTEDDEQDEEEGEEEEEEYDDGVDEGHQVADKTRAPKRQPRSSKPASMEPTKDAGATASEGVAAKNDRPSGTFAIFVMSTQLTLQFYVFGHHTTLSLTNGCGQTFVNGGRYWATMEDKVLLSSTRVANFPPDVCMPKTPRSVFQQADQKTLASLVHIIGIVTSVESPRPIRTKAGRDVQMREIVVQTITDRDEVRLLPATLWGAISDIAPGLGNAVILVNAKPSTYQNNPRVSIGDNGAVVVLRGDGESQPDELDQVKEMRKFIRERQQAAMVGLPLPSGVQPWRPE